MNFLHFVKKHSVKVKILSFVHYVLFRLVKKCYICDNYMFKP